MVEKFQPQYPVMLRVLADLIEKHNLIPPYTVDGTANSIGIHDYTDEAPQHMAEWRRALGGTWKKRDNGSTIILAQAAVESLPGSPEVSLFISKSSCVRRVVGTKEVKIPAVKAAPARVATEDIVEWDCEPVLAGVVS
jgi:hypothetical protein